MKVYTYVFFFIWELKLPQWALPKGVKLFSGDWVHGSVIELPLTPGMGQIYSEIPDNSLTSEGLESAVWSLLSGGQNWANKVILSQEDVRKEFYTLQSRWSYQGEQIQGLSAITCHPSAWAHLTDRSWPSFPPNPQRISQSDPTLDFRQSRHSI